MIEKFIPEPQQNMSTPEAREKNTNETTHNEHIPSSKTILEFLNLTESDLEEFKLRLQDAHGHLRIWMHPLFTEQWPASIRGRLGDADLTKVQEQLRASFFKTTSSVAANEHSSPLVVYEAVNKLEVTSNLIATHLQSSPSKLTKLGIIFVPTESASPSPDLDYLIKSLQSGDTNDRSEAERLIELKNAINSFVGLKDKHREEAHLMFADSTNQVQPFSRQQDSERITLQHKQDEEARLAAVQFGEAIVQSRQKGDDFMLSLFRQVGIKSAIVSGVYLDVGENPRTNMKEFQACAGTVVQKLRDAGIPTDISRNIWPPKELIRTSGLEVKQTKQSTNL